MGLCCEGGVIFTARRMRRAMNGYIYMSLCRYRGIVLGKLPRDLLVIGAVIRVVTDYSCIDDVTFLNEQTATLQINR